MTKSNRIEFFLKSIKSVSWNPFYCLTNALKPNLEVLHAFVWARMKPFDTVRAKIAALNMCGIYTDRYPVLPMFHFNRVWCTMPMRWHFEIYFSLRKTFPRLSLSQRCASRLTGHSLGSRGGFEKKFARWVPSTPSVHLRLVRRPGMWESGGEGGGGGWDETSPCSGNGSVN